MKIWQWVQDELLGMHWLNEAIGAGLQALGVDTAGRLGASVQFFLYDTVKITVLLCVLIFGISCIQSYFPPERTRRILGRFRGLWANILAALLGTVTPFCSCSSIPLFIGFTSAGLPLGVTFSFLIWHYFLGLKDHGSFPCKADSRSSSYPLWSYRLRCLYRNKSVSLFFAMSCRSKLWPDKNVVRDSYTY